MTSGRSWCSTTTGTARPDLLITQVAGPTVLLQNYTGGKHWLTVAPEGPSDAGIGARVSVTAGGRTTTQILLAGGSYLAGPPREAYFGLDAAPTAESRPDRLGERHHDRGCATSRRTRSSGCRLADQPPSLGGSTATLSQRPPVARRMTNIFANGEVVRASSAPEAS